MADDVKRKLIAYQSSKKLRKELNRIEDLSNEFFYEIFDYLDACDIYKAFSNLNDRFQQLLHSSSVLFRINFEYPMSEEIYMNGYKPMILLNKQQIFSMEAWLPGDGKYFFSSFIVDSTLNRLESLIIKWIDSDVVIPLLVNLASLPRLFFLTIDTQTTDAIINDIYQLIFALPVLKSNNFSTNGWNHSISLPIPTQQQCSTIERLVIDHPCNVSELACLISYTPQLRHLSVYHSIKNDPAIIPMTLPNLTYLCIHTDGMKFDELGVWITRISSNLKVLRLHLSNDTTFFNAHWWEQFLLGYFPGLKKFYLIHYDNIGNGFQHPKYLHGSNQFSSSFWIERQWVLEVDLCGRHLMYSIRPYRRRWYEYLDHKIGHSSVKYAKLTITCSHSTKVIRADVKRVLTRAQIYHLEIRDTKVFVDVVIRTIDLLSDLITLKIHSLSVRKSRKSFAEKLTKSGLEEQKNKITKVYLEEMKETEEFDFLFKLCPFMEHFRVGCLNSIDMKSFLGHVLKKIHHDSNHHFRSLCFRVPAADDQTIQTVQKMIHDDKLLIDPTIKRVLDDIHIQWK